MRKVFSVVLLLVASAASAQTLSPPVIEAKAAKPGKFAKTQITVTNNSLLPEAVTITPKSMNVFKDGTWSRRTLDPDINVRLSEASFRLPAKQSRIVYIDVQCVKYPCNVAVVANFAGTHNDEGLAVEFHIGAALYLCEKDVNHCRDTFRKKTWNLEPTPPTSSQQ